jgi:hypothetical protein
VSYGSARQIPADTRPAAPLFATLRHRGWRRLLHRARRQRTGNKLPRRNIDATFNLALLLQRKGSHAEAADYWRRYLASDRSSEWASRARRSLKFCEIPDSDKAA